ncbi:MAG: DUF4476 domain-containing protein [Bacteroidales bacterium]|nr:DUF4476 domain-containing protein [Bacteroidales bacterium]MBN2757593.1 DUF4476 domain-containing protein [Bacteroidales bacterium]
MKKTLIILLSIIYINSQAQSVNECKTAISNFEFQQKFNFINSRKNDKLIVAKKIAITNCLSTVQVIKIAELFEEDLTKLDFVQSAYKNTIDKENFYDVYNSFIYFSTVFRLHDYIKAVDLKSDNILILPEKELTFPEYDYPLSNKYNGKMACILNLKDEAFYQEALKISKLNAEAEKMKEAQNITNKYCMSCEQLMKFASLLSSETNRLSLLKSSYPHIYDLDNYSYTLQLLKNPIFKGDLTKFINSNNGSAISTKPACSVSDNEFNNIQSQIKKQSFSNTKKNLAKQLIKSKKCFKTVQIIEIIKLFDFSNLKLELAKYAYDYTTDKENYSKVADVLSFEFDKKELLDYIKTKK